MYKKNGHNYKRSIVTDDDSSISYLKSPTRNILLVLELHSRVFEHVNVAKYHESLYHYDAPIDNQSHQILRHDLSM